MKGIILAGGSGTRLYPVTKTISKQLLPVGSKPMIYYPLSTLMGVGIREILIISTPDDIGSYKKLLGDGSRLGILLKYKIQPSPDGLAQAFLLGEEFIGNDPVTLILGDNILIGKSSKKIFSDAIIKSQKENKSYIFGYKVDDPKRFGVAEFDKDKNIIGIEEKPEFPKSDYAIIGFYCYTNDVIEKAKMLTPSKRGELEITALNELYLRENKLKIQLVDDELFWIDTGTINSLYAANVFIDKFEKKHSSKLGCIEEVAFKNGLISKEKLLLSIEDLGNNEYSNYIKQLLKNEI